MWWINYCSFNNFPHFIIPSSARKAGVPLSSELAYRLSIERPTVTELFAPLRREASSSLDEFTPNLAFVTPFTPSACWWLVLPTGS